MVHITIGRDLFQGGSKGGAPSSFAAPGQARNGVQTVLVLISEIFIESFFGVKRAQFVDDGTLMHFDPALVGRP